MLGVVATVFVLLFCVVVLVGLAPGEFVLAARDFWVARAAGRVVPVDAQMRELELLADRYVLGRLTLEDFEGRVDGVLRRW